MLCSMPPAYCEPMMTEKKGMSSNYAVHNGAEKDEQEALDTLGAGQYREVAQKLAKRN
jgi:hypothetical protein